MGGGSPATSGSTSSGTGALSYLSWSHSGEIDEATPGSAGNPINALSMLAHTGAFKVRSLVHWSKTHLQDNGVYPTDWSRIVVSNSQIAVQHNGTGSYVGTTPGHRGTVGIRFRKLLGSVGSGITTAGWTSAAAWRDGEVTPDYFDLLLIAQAGAYGAGSSILDALIQNQLRETNTIGFVMRLYRDGVGDDDDFVENGSGDGHVNVVGANTVPTTPWANSVGIYFDWTLESAGPTASGKVNLLLE